MLNQTYDGYDIELCFPKRYIKSTNGRLSWGTKLNWPDDIVKQQKGES